MVKGLNSKFFVALECVLEVNEFELQLHYYVYFRTDTLGEKYESPYPPWQLG